MVLMILKNALELSQSIVYLRRTLYEFVKEKSLTDSEVIKLRQQLDKKIRLYQKMIEEVELRPNC